MVQYGEVFPEVRQRIAAFKYWQEFKPGDTVVQIGYERTCTVLQATSDWYVLMWNDYIGMSEKLPVRYVEDNFVLVESLGEKDDDK